MPKQMADPIVGKRIKMARCGADLSREELAEQVSDRIGYSISDEFLRRIEIAERDVELGILKAISDITGEPIEWLTNGDMRPYLNWALDQTDQPELDLVYAEAS